MARQIPLTCPGHTRPVVHLAFSGLVTAGSAHVSSAPGYYLITACKDGKPMLRHGNTGDWIGTFEGHKGAVWGAGLSREGTLAVTGAADFTAKMWSVASGDEMISHSHPHIVKTVDFSMDSKYVATGCVDQVIRIFDVESKVSEPTHQFKTGSPIKVVLWSQNADILLATAEEGLIRMFDCRVKEEVKSVNLSQAASMVTSMELSWDHTILTVAHGNQVSFLKSDSLEVLHTHQFPTVQYSASLHTSKTCFITGGDDFKLRKCDFVTGNELESYKGHFGPIHCVRYSPDGELYGSGAEDGTVRLWQHNIGTTYGLWKNNSDLTD